MPMTRKAIATATMIGSRPATTGDATALGGEIFGIGKFSICSQL
jgi:hypothetical protein